MKNLMIAAAVLFLGLNASAKTLHYVDYEGVKHKVEVSINDGGIIDQLLLTSSKISLEDFNNVELKLSPLESEQTKAFRAEAPRGTYSTSMKSAALREVLISLGNDAAMASRQDIQDMLNNGMLNKKYSVEELCPQDSRGTIVLTIQDFGFLNYCLID